MSILVIGGDRLGNIKKNLLNLGFREIYHIDGRKKSHVNIEIPSKIDIVLILTDYVGHNFAKQIKNRTKNIQVKALFAKRSWAHIHREFSNQNDLLINQ